jgi:hypothetical protein
MYFIEDKRKINTERIQMLMGLHKILRLWGLNNIISNKIEWVHLYKHIKKLFYKIKFSIKYNNIWMGDIERMM